MGPTRLLYSSGPFSSYVDFVQIESFQKFMDTLFCQTINKQIIICLQNQNKTMGIKI